MSRRDNENDDAARVIEELSAYIAANGLTVSALARQLAIPRSTVAQWLREGVSRTLPSRQHLAKVVSFLDGLDNLADKATATNERIEKIRMLLLLLESEIRWFRDGTPEARDTFRNRLDPYDVGYIASLLMMMEKESSFQRWLALTTNRFQYFGKGK